MVAAVVVVDMVVVVGRVMWGRGVVPMGLKGVTENGLEEVGWMTGGSMMPLLFLATLSITSMVTVVGMKMLTVVITSVVGPSRSSVSRW